jgi:hypothetical protein
MRSQQQWFLGLLVILFALISSAKASDPYHCAVCGQSLGNTVYTALDKVTNEKVFICYDCCICPDECYVCGLPVRANCLKLPDGRFLCARDGKTAILDETKARDICEDVRDSLDRLLSRFMTFPTNADVALVDRVDLYDEFKIVGNDFECPDVLGYIQRQTNRVGLKYTISLMSALPRAEFEATCAHEYSHAWVFENVPSERRKTLSRDAHEGFCELVAFLLMDSLHEEGQKRRMLQNNYTRGQIALFIEAEKKFGFNDVLDWMRWGVNSRLKTGNVRDVRNVEIPRSKSASNTNLSVYVGTLAPAPDTLVLKGISFSRNQPLALINNQSFAVGESAKVRVETTNVLVRCLAIGEHSVRVQIVDSGREMELRLASEK